MVLSPVIRNKYLFVNIKNISGETFLKNVQYMDHLYVFGHQNGERFQGFAMDPTRRAYNVFPPSTRIPVAMLACSRTLFNLQYKYWGWLKYLDKPLIAMLYENSKKLVWEVFLPCDKDLENLD